MKPILAVIFFLCVVNQSYSQQGKFITREQIKSQKIGFITQHLNLTVEEAQVFWPVFNEYEAKKEEIQKKKVESLKELKQPNVKISEKEMESLADLQITLKLAEAKLAEEYHVKFKKVLPIAKVLKLYQSDYRFTNYLLKQVRNKMENTNNQGKGNKGKANEEN